MDYGMEHGLLSGGGRGPRLRPAGAACPGHPRGVAPRSPSRRAARGARGAAGVRARAVGAERAADAAQGACVRAAWSTRPRDLGRLPARNCTGASPLRVMIGSAGQAALRLGRMPLESGQLVCAERQR